MMNGKGMLVICGNSVAELEKELEMLKLAISTGATMGCGGSTIGGVEQALKALTSAVGGTSPIVEDKCNCDCCCCDCNCDCEDEYDDEEIEYCPNCGDILDEDGYCESCGYYWEDAEEDDDDEPTPSELLGALMDCLNERGEMTTPIGCLLDLLDGMM
jgi:hypothetical protein